jgi:hypothetical protein
VLYLIVYLRVVWWLATRIIRSVLHLKLWKSTSEYGLGKVGLDIRWWTVA